MLYLDQLDLFRLGVYRITHRSVSMGLKPAVNPAKAECLLESCPRGEFLVLRGPLVYHQKRFSLYSMIPL